MNLEGNLHLDGKGGLGIPQDRTEPSFFALITGQGDGVSSPRHFYSWLRLYHDGYNGSWRVMDGISNPTLKAWRSYTVPVTNQILIPAVEMNKNEGVPTDSNTTPTKDNFNGAIVWITPTYNMNKVEYGFTYQPILKWGLVKYDFNSGGRTEGENTIELVPCKRWDDPTFTGAPDITCFIYSPYNVTPVFTDLKAGNIVCYIQATRNIGFLMPIRPVVVKFGKLTADWVLYDNTVTITPVDDPDTAVPTGEANRLIYLFTPGGQIGVRGVSLVAGDIVAYVPWKANGYMIDCYHGVRNLDCDNNEIAAATHEFKWGSGFTITRTMADHQQLKIDLNIEIKSSDGYVEVDHSSVNSDGNYCREVWDIKCPYSAGTYVTIGPLTQFNNSSNCIEIRSAHLYPCNFTVVHTNWTNLICGSPCNNG